MKQSSCLCLLVCLGLAGTLFLLPPEARPQSAKPGATLIDGHSFATVPITDGLPSFPPIKKWINSGGS